jgi:hypothetical protein
MNFPRLAVLVLAGLAVSRVSAADLYPHETGRAWRYVTPTGQHDILVAGSPVSMTVGGQTVLAQPFVFASGSVHAGATELLTFPPEGGVRLVGATDASGVGFLYSPPILLLPAPAYYYDYYNDIQVTQAYSVPGGAQTTLFYTFGVTEAPITVPAGSFAGASGSMRAVPASASGDYSPDVWAVGVGCVQYLDGEFFQLEGVDDPTGTTPATWGAIKRLYR